MNRRKAVTLTLAIFVLAAFALPSAALARTAFYTGVGEIESESFSAYAAPINLGTGASGAPTRISTEGPPSDVAITPDGSTAYIAGAFDELVGIDVATNTEARSVSMSGEPWAVAIAPDGKHAYTANLWEDSVSILDLKTLTEVTSIPVTGSPNGVAVTPDGTRLYVTIQDEDRVAIIDLATNTEVGSIPVGEAPRGIAVTPDGKRLVVVNRDGNSVSIVDVATNSVTQTIPTGAPAGYEEWVAITPDGTHAYVTGHTPNYPFESWVTPIDLTSGTAGTTTVTSGHVGDIAVLPAGNRGFLTHWDERLAAVSGKQTSVVHENANELLPLNLAANSLEAGLETYEFPEALAIVPNQGPHAAIEGPASGAAGADLSFNGSKSSDSDGTVTGYAWDFGDGTGASGAAVHHTYAKAGTYQVTLTTTDNEGCSLSQVFTGQTMYCNGSSAARTTHQVVVTSNAVARCPQVSGNASSFVPKIRPGNVVPGVRVRLATDTPSRFDVQAKLQYSVNGKSGSAKLGSLSVSVKHWRRIRFAIPSGLRDLLPLGTAVTLKLTITTTPEGGPACAGSVIHKTLHVHVVKVFPNAVQFGRVR
jgi:YVTN family beta-propeller protein